MTLHVVDEFSGKRHDVPTVGLVDAGLDGGSKVGEFRPDMFGEIRHDETFRTVPVVPNASVVQREGRTSVWRERAPGDFEAVDVTIGRSSGGVTPLLSGIQAGDRVVIDGVMLLEHGN